MAGQLRLTVDALHSLHSKARVSDEVEVGGVPWKIKLERNEEDAFARLSIFTTHHQPLLFSISVNARIKIFNRDDIRSKVIEIKERITNDQCVLDDITLEWDEITDESFETNGAFNVEAELHVVCTSGIRIPRAIDFTTSGEEIAFVVEGEKVYAVKNVMASSSRFFESMFFGDFDEKDKKEIELKNVKKEEFTVLLNHLFTPHLKVKEHEVTYLLKLADQFEMTVILEKVQVYLMKKTAPDDYSMLLLADQYGLYDLSDKITSSLKSNIKLNNLRSSPAFRKLSDTMQSSIFKKYVSRVRPSTTNK